MKTGTTLLAAALLLASAGPAPAAEQSIAEEVMEGCKTEIENFCQQVTKGEGRILACLYAHGDKLSGQCDYALYDAAVRLERAINAVTYVAKECRADIESHCADVQMGEGRIAQCLEEHKGELSQGCTQAFEDVGLE